MFGRVVAVSVEAVMFRRFRIGVLAATVALGGVSVAQAAVITIGSLNLVGDFSGAFIDVENSTEDDFADFFGEGAVFTNVVLTFDPGPLTAETAQLADIQPGAGIQFIGFSPAFVVPPNGQLSASLTLSLSFVGGGTPAGQLSVDPLDLSGAAQCLDDEVICKSVPILYTTASDEIPVPEPATLLLLAGGLGAMAGRRVRRRE